MVVTELFSMLVDECPPQSDLSPKPQQHVVFLACVPSPRSSTVLTWTSETETSSIATQVSSTTASSTNEELTTLASTIETSSSTETVVEASTSSAESTSTTAESTTSTAVDTPVQTVEFVENRGFESATLDPWNDRGGADAGLSTTNQREGSQCYRMSGPYMAPTFSVCQTVGVDQGYEYTFTAWIKQICEVERDGGFYTCDSDVNKAELYVDSVYSSGQVSVPSDAEYHEFTGTFQYVGPSIDATDLCIQIAVGEGDQYNLFVDSVSFARGKSVPIPEDE
ncbi:hypothetical protein NM208_g12441 [Fusarium decemcellulare]|uniref:Uncharacterized protein n=1 Tax=Fusarium decemcellulare TaxID=57161 RepID=A0ACC1RR72_9HYPO|nr:hypothetical protein NM208_g12441 [Fusarium decemcellulare]